MPAEIVSPTAALNLRDRMQLTFSVPLFFLVTLTALVVASPAAISPTVDDVSAGSPVVDNRSANRTVSPPVAEAQLLSSCNGQGSLRSCTVDTRFNYNACVTLRDNWRQVDGNIRITNGQTQACGDGCCVSWRLNNWLEDHNLYDNRPTFGQARSALNDIINCGAHSGGAVSGVVYFVPIGLNCGRVCVGSGCER